MSEFVEKAKKGILRRLSVFTGLGPNLIDRKASWPFVPRTPSSTSFDQWRYEQPVDVTNPMAIRRNMGRRATFDSIWRSNYENEEDSIGDTDGQHEEGRNKGKQLLERSMSSSENSLLSSTHSENEEYIDSYINAVFRSDEINHSDCFLSAFGSKGNNVGQYQDAKDITCLPGGELLVTDLINDRLQICSTSEPFARTLSPNVIKQPWATAVTQDNGIAVTQCREKCVKIFNMDGEFITKFGQQYFVRPTGLAVDFHGNFIVCDSVTDQVLMFDRKGTFIRFLGKSFIQEECFNTPRYVCVSVTGEIIVSDGGNHKVKVFDPDGNFLRSFGSFGKGDKQFKCPYGISTNKYGDIFVSDHYNSRISMFSREGVFIRHVVTSDHGLVHPQALTVSPDLHMYVTHGYLKANEILVYKLTDALDYEYFNIISYV